MNNKVINYVKLGWGLLLLAQYLVAIPCQAYGIGVLPLPNSLSNYQQLMLQNPGQCEQQLNHRLSALSSQSQVTQQSSDSSSIVMYQLMALCANLNGSPIRALAHIHEAITQQKGNSPQLSARSYLIQTQLLLVNSQVDQARIAFVKAQQAISQLTALPLLIHFEMILTDARLQLQQQHQVIAQNLFNQALSLAKQSHHPILLGWAQTWLGLYYQHSGQLEQALTHYTQAIRYASSQSPAASFLRNHLHHYLSQIYQQQPQWSKAIHYQQNAIGAAEQLGNTALIARSVADIALIYQQMHNYDLALVHYLNAQDIARQSQSWRLVAKIDFWLGQTYLLNQNSTQALEHLNIARHYFQNPIAPLWLVKTLILLSEIHIANQEPALAILQLTKAEQLTTQLPSSTNADKIEHLLAIAYQQSGAYEQALIHYKLYHHLMQNYQQLQRHISQTQFANHYQFIEQQQQVNQLLQANQRLQQQSNDRRLLIIILIVLCLVLFIFWLTAKLRLRQNYAQRRELIDRLYYNPRTGWPSLETADRPLKQLRRLGHYPMNNGLSPSSSHVIVMMRLCGEMFQNQHSGFAQRKQLETSFAHHIYHHLGERYLACHLGGTSYLFITPYDAQEPEQLCEQLLDIVSQFIHTRQLPYRVAIGCCLSPFLNRSPDAISDSGLVEIAHMALEMAIAQTANSKLHQWVVLRALSCSPAAFFQSEQINQDIQDAVHKGLVKVVSSTDNKAIISSVIPTSAKH
ncbi:tetratricopeptide repeat protein [Celerinatantimonas yamalensis]|uniref:GGDEF domain-containing protein n=1 Tax=Celerinatantimonas yamalensis TaxID=559956 RepID=A0ABW9G822_9GAMM